jgi:hypothetical protein
MKTFQELLAENGACGAARTWAADKTIEEVVAECHRGDWLLWLAYRIGIDTRQLILPKAHCANTVRHLMKDVRSINAVDIAIAYGEGRATDEELRKAACAAADAAEIMCSTLSSTNEEECTSALWLAAESASSAAYLFSYSCATYSAQAAESYAYHTLDADSAANAIHENIKQTADICRQYIGQAIIERVNELLNQ